LDLIVLFFLAREIGRLASRKGFKPATWRLYTVVAWIITEIIGLLVGFTIFEKNNLFSIGMTGIAFAITSYFIIKAQLNKFPDYIDDDINNIGNN
jgi:hypothetical protein